MTNEFNEKAAFERYAQRYYKPSSGGRPDRKLNPDNCSARLFSNYCSYQCNNKAKFNEGGHGWCGIHKPSRRVAKEKAEHEKRQRYWQKVNILEARRLANYNIVEVAKKYFMQQATHDELEKAVNEGFKCDNTPLPDKE